MNSADAEPALPSTPAPEAGPAEAARRGSQAIFPVAWSAFLLMATGLTVLRAGTPAGLPVAAARTPARDLFSVIALGIALVWPMIRLSETAARDPRERAWRSLGDALVVVTPALTVVIASQLVIGWGWATTATIALMLVSWTSLIGALLAFGTGARSGASRAAWMALIALVTLGAPGAMSLAGPADAAAERVLMLASPATGVYELTASGSGVARQPPAGAWVAAALPGVLAVPVWALALAGFSGRRGVHSGDKGLAPPAHEPGP